MSHLYLVRHAHVYFWNEIVESDQNALICSHGNPLFFLFQHLAHQPLHLDPTINKPPGYPPKASVRRIEKMGEKFVVGDLDSSIC